MKQFKAPYMIIHIQGDQIPTVDDLARKAVALLDRADGYSFDCTNASPEVKKFVDSSLAAVSQRVQLMLDDMANERMFNKAREMSVHLAPLILEIGKLTSEIGQLRADLAEMKKNGPGNREA